MASGGPLVIPLNLVFMQRFTPRPFTVRPIRSLHLDLKQLKAHAKPSLGLGRGPVSSAGDLEGR